MLGKKLQLEKIQTDENGADMVAKTFSNEK